MADRAKEIVETNGYSKGSIIWYICIIVYLIFSILPFGGGIDRERH